VADDSKQKWTIKRDSTMIRNQKLSFNNRDRNIYLACLPMKQRQGIIHTHVRRSNIRARKKRGTNRTHSLSWNPLTGSNRHK